MIELLYFNHPISMILLQSRSVSAPNEKSKFWKDHKNLITTSVSIEYKISSSDWYSYKRIEVIRTIGTLVGKPLAVLYWAHLYLEFRVFTQWGVVKCIRWLPTVSIWIIPNLEEKNRCNTFRLKWIKHSAHMFLKFILFVLYFSKDLNYIILCYT